MSDLPQHQRLAAYAVIVNEGRVLLTRLAPHLFPAERWTLPGGGVDFGEHPRDAVVREVHEETGLEAHVGEAARVFHVRRPAERDGLEVDYHAVRLVFEGWVDPDSPEPRVVEVDGTTVDAAWHSLEAVLGGQVPVTPIVLDALRDHLPLRRQRLAVKAVIRRDDTILLARLSSYAVESGRWTLPGGGVDHGESPEEALVREIREETGLTATPGMLLGVNDKHLTGNAPDGRLEDFHAVNLVYAAQVADGEPRVEEVEGTTDAVAWVPLADIESGTVQVTELVRFALSL